MCGWEMLDPYRRYWTRPTVGSSLIWSTHSSVGFGYDGPSESIRERMDPYMDKSGNLVKISFHFGLWITISN